jgi:hypothetical protein
MRRAVLALLTMLLVPAAPAAADVTAVALPPGSVASDLAPDGAGRMLVADQGNGRVVRLSGDGAVVDTIGEGILPSDSALFVAGGPDGRAYVLGGDHVTRLGPGGALEASWTMQYGAGIAVDAASNVYAWSFQGITRFGAAGEPGPTWRVEDAAGQALMINDMAAGASGVVVLATPSFNSSRMYVLRYAPDGTLLDRWTGVDGDPPQAGVLHRESDLSLDAAGNVYLSDGDRVWQYTADGRFLAGFAPNRLSAFSPGSCDGASGGSGSLFQQVSLYGLTLDQAGTMFTRTYGSVSRIANAPIAKLLFGPAGYDPKTRGSSVATGQRITLNASFSRVPFGEGRYEWDFDGDGAYDRDTGAQAQTVTAYARAGAVTPRVRITAPGGGSSIASTSYAVLDSRAYLDVEGIPSGFPPKPPPGIAMTGREVAFTAGRSVIAPCGQIDRVEWDLDGDGDFERDTGTVLRAITTYTKTGRVTPRVRITRVAGRVDVGELSVDVRPGPAQGPVGVSIEDGALYTNDPTVRLDLVWPKYATAVLVSGDGGFKRAKRFDLGKSVPWTLPSTGPERVPKNVYVRFEVPDDGPGYGDPKASTQTYSDDVILDTTVPVTTAARVVSRRSLRVAGRDRLSGAGTVQITTNRRKPGKRIAFRKKLRGSRAFSQSFTYTAKRGATWVRVIDRAGNPSGWKRAAR